MADLQSLIVFNTFNHFQYRISFSMNHDCLPDLTEGPQRLQKAVPAAGQANGT